jgi:hypothetical protein
MQPTLGLVVIAKDSARFISRLLKQARLYADSIYVFVDIDSSDDTFGVCKPLCDHIEKIETPGWIEPVLQYVYEVPETSHVLRVDSDELMGTRFVEARDQILARPEVAFWMPRYNLVGRREDYYFDRLYPDLQLRLFRKGAIKTFPNIHITPEINGATADIDNVHIFHVKYGERSREERTKLMNHYDKILQGAGSGIGYKYYMLPEEMPVKTIKKCEEQIAKNQEGL